MKLIYFILITINFVIIFMLYNLNRKSISCKVIKNNIRTANKKLTQILEDILYKNKDEELFSELKKYMLIVEELFGYLFPGNSIILFNVKLNDYVSDLYVESFSIKEIENLGTTSDKEMKEYYNINKNTDLKKVINEGYSKVIICDIPNYLKNNTEFITEKKELVNSGAYICVPIQKKIRSGRKGIDTYLLGCYTICFEKTFLPYIDVELLYPILDNLSVFLYELITRRSGSNVFEIKIRHTEGNK